MATGEEEMREGKEIRPDRSERERDSSSAVPRTSAWQDPRTWVSILGLLLTISLFVLGMIASQLGSINTAVQAIRDSSIESRTKIGSLEERMSKMEAAKVLQDTYVNNVRERVIKLEAKEEKGK